MMRIYLADIREVTGFSSRQGFCARASRAWADRHGLDWRDFRRNGIEEEKLLAIGDAFAVALVEQTRARRGGNHHGR